MVKHKKLDRRVQRTQQLLREALFSLVRERGFEDLSVQDILDRANIGRATFYAHFDNKEDLLFSGFDDLRHSLQQLQRGALARRTDPDTRLFAFSHEAFAHANQFREVFRSMIGKRSGAMVQQIFRKIFVELIRNEIRMETHSRGERQIDRTEATVHFLADGLSGMLLWWLDGKERLSVDEINILFRKLAVPAVKSTLQRD